MRNLICIAAIAASLVACSGGSTSNVSGDTEDVARDAGRDSRVGDSSPDSGIDSRVSLADVDAGEDEQSRAADAGTDTAEPHDSGSSNASADAARPDASDSGSLVDAARDSSTAPVDSGPEASTSLDAGIDSGPVGCVGGEKRCVNYKQETCSDGTHWTSDNNQSCCTDARFVPVSEFMMRDSVTGKRWFRRISQMGCGQSLQDCDISVQSSGLGTGWRTPLMSEMQAIMIGKSVNNFSVCSPAIDHVEFPFAGSYPFQCLDGYVDHYSGLEVRFAGQWPTCQAFCIHD